MPPADDLRAAYEAIDAWRIARAAEDRAPHDVLPDAAWEEARRLRRVAVAKLDALADRLAAHPPRVTADDWQRAAEIVADAAGIGENLRAVRDRLAAREETDACTGRAGKGEG